MRLAVNLPGLNLKNPIMPASGTFGFGDVPSAKKFDLNQLGALVIKTATVEPRVGNPDPKIAVIDNGVLNAVFALMWPLGMSFYWMVSSIARIIQNFIIDKFFIK